MLAASDGLLDHLQPESILRVGDNLARDAAYFKRRFPHARCIAADLYVDGIQQAVADGWVDDVLFAAAPIRKEVRSGCSSEHLSKPTPDGASGASSSADGSHRELVRSGGWSGRPPGGG